MVGYLGKAMTSGVYRCFTALTFPRPSVDNPTMVHIKYTLALFPPVQVISRRESVAQFIV